MHPFEQKISGFITRHRLISPHERRLIVAISGGADSVALLAALTALGHKCLAAHCNFHLRGEESNRDARHVADVCDSLGADLSIRHFDVEARRKASGESTEMACRSLRYEWFSLLAEKEQCRSVAVAHHRDDNAETMLLNLMRGTGLAGLTGMSPRNGLIVRPMLECTRKEAEQYVRDRGLEFITDSSNASNEYLRNRLRNIVIPTMQECFPNASEAISHTISCLRDTEQFYRSAIEDKRTAYMPDSSHIFISKLTEREPQAQLLLYEWLKPLGFNASQAADILHSNRSGSTFQAGSTLVTLSRGIAEITDSSASDLARRQATVDISDTILSPAFIAVSRHSAAEFKPERDSNVLYLDESVLDGSPNFELRHWHDGDFIEPFGMHGRRKISDIFSDAKLSLNDKKDVWLLTRDDTVLWVVGMRASRHFAITPDTRRYLRLQWRPGQPHNFGT